MRKYFYHRILPHLQKDYRPIFVTFATYKRSHLPQSVRCLVLDSCLQEHRHKIELHAAVVMPDHVHLIFTPLTDAEEWTYALPGIMRTLKGRAAHNINQALHRSGPVWQQEFFDHVLRCNEGLGQKVNYICDNPVAGRTGRSPVPTSEKIEQLCGGLCPLQAAARRG